MFARRNHKRSAAPRGDGVDFRLPIRVDGDFTVLRICYFLEEVSSGDGIRRAPHVEHGNIAKDERALSAPSVRRTDARIAHALPRTCDGLCAVITRLVRLPPGTARTEHEIPLAMLPDARCLRPVLLARSPPTARVVEIVVRKFCDVDGGIALAREDVVCLAVRRIDEYRHVAALLAVGEVCGID